METVKSKNGPLSSKERELQVSCSGGGFITTTSCNSSRSTYVDCIKTSAIACEGSSHGSKSDCIVANSQMNYNTMLSSVRNVPNPLTSNHTCNGTTFNIDDSSTNWSSRGDPQRSILATAPPSTSTCNSLSTSCNYNNGNLECSSGGVESVRSLSPPDAKRQRTMLEKTCAIWEGFEPLKPSRQLTVSE